MKINKKDGINKRPYVGPCHHGKARPQVVDGGKASDMEGSCEYIRECYDYPIGQVRLQQQPGNWQRYKLDLLVVQ